MCGIVGIISKQKAGLFKYHADAFKQMLFVDQLRGTDGTGLMYNDDDKILSAKEASASGTFLGREYVKNAIDTAVKTGNFIIGHNRSATKGSHTWQNTHPFREEHISLIHNGTLYTHKNLDEKKEVDSHAICSHMAIHGAKETLKNIDGAFALVWIDEKENTINMARNKERPLHLIECTSCWIISSELGLGLWMAERHNMKVLDSFQLETETWYSMAFEDLTTWNKETVEYYKWAYSGAWGYGGFNKGDDFFNSKRAKRNKRNRHQHEQKGNVILLPDTSKKTGVDAANETTQFYKGIKLFGEELVFSPDYLPNKDKNSCLIWDDKKEKYFLLGKIDGQPNTEVRFYGEYKDVKPFIEEPLLCGVINYKVIKAGRRLSYHVEDVVALVGDKNSKVVNEDIVVCDVCTEAVDKRLSIFFKGVHLCKVCHEAFEENPKMAEDMGYY